MSYLSGDSLGLDTVQPRVALNAASSFLDLSVGITAMDHHAQLFVIIHYFTYLSGGTSLEVRRQLAGIGSCTMWVWGD